MKHVTTASILHTNSWILLLVSNFYNICTFDFPRKSLLLLNFYHMHSFYTFARMIPSWTNSSHTQYNTAYTFNSILNQKGGGSFWFCIKLPACLRDCKLECEIFAQESGFPWQTPCTVSVWVGPLNLETTINTIHVYKLSLRPTYWWMGGFAIHLTHKDNLADMLPSG